MPIKSIEIQYYKSFKECKALLKDVNIIIGENGSGKSNFIEAIDYFYQNLTETHLSDTIFDANNRYSNFVRIGVSYDLSHLEAIAKSKRNLSEEGKNVPYLSFLKNFKNSRKRQKLDCDSGNGTDSKERHSVEL